MTKEIKLKSFVMVMAVLVILEILLLIIFKLSDDDENRRYCEEAVCNEDASLCYTYDLDENGDTVVVWRGSCQK